jgi:hypothetical protein
MIDHPPDFICAICERPVDNRFPGARQTMSLPPVCRYCENVWGRRVPPKGAFRDRRIIRQGCALAEALSAEAYRRNNPRYPYGT